MAYRRMSSIKKAGEFQAHLAALGLELPFDEVMQTGPSAPLAQPLAWPGGLVGNRFAILAMEGWDGTEDGRPTAWTRRRWRRFGESGAKLIWGGEAIAVRPDGRAHPNQLLLEPRTVGDLVSLREELVGAHARHFGDTNDLFVGLQLTHSGRFASPTDNRVRSPLVLYRHPYLDEKFARPADGPVLTDDAVARLTEDYVTAARLAHQAGFAFVDVKHCHGYLGHEFLSAVERPGRYGGSFENRTRFLRDVVAGIRAAAPGLHVGVRVSVFDFAPFQPGSGHVGEPMSLRGPTYPYAFGGDGSGVGIDLTEPHRFLELLEQLDIRWVCSTAGSPYYNPHIQRPAAFPPSDGYLPPEDPLVGVVRQLGATRSLKTAHPGLIFVGSGYSYLQEWLANVGQRLVREGAVDFVGLGRMVLSYPDFPADVLAGRPLQRKRLCRTFSDCTTAPRNGLVSGCYPLDPAYKESPEMVQLTRVKKGIEEE
jgi:NADPH2 dehydrogenase